MYYSDFIEEGTYLAHHGVKGQRWGVRRYQDKGQSYKKLKFKKSKYKNIVEAEHKGLKIAMFDKDPNLFNLNKKTSDVLINNWDKVINASKIACDQFLKEHGNYLPDTFKLSGFWIGGETVGALYDGGRGLITIEIDPLTKRVISTGYDD